MRGPQLAARRSQHMRRQQIRAVAPHLSLAHSATPSPPHQPDVIFGSSRAYTFVFASQHAHYRPTSRSDLARSRWGSNSRISSIIQPASCVMKLSAGCRRQLSVSRVPAVAVQRWNKAMRWAQRRQHSPQRSQSTNLLTPQLLGIPAACPFPRSWRSAARATASPACWRRSWG